MTDTEKGDKKPQRRCSMTKRKGFSPEFKREAVRLLETSQKSSTNRARELDVRRNQLYKGKEQLGKRDAVNQGDSTRSLSWRMRNRCRTPSSFRPPLSVHTHPRYSSRSTIRSFFRDNYFLDCSLLDSHPSRVSLCESLKGRRIYGIAFSRAVLA